MNEKKIVVDIDETGSIKAETFGFNGVGCVAELEKLMKDIALTTEGTKKEEYFDEGVSNKNSVNIKND